MRDNPKQQIEAIKIKITAIFLILSLLFYLAGCKNDNNGKLTIETVCDLAAEKGEKLTWSDFEQYPSVETGSGLYILSYEIDGNYRLWIGGAPDTKPMYIKLVCVDDYDQSIDIRYDNIEEFLEKTK